jgi:hypothetical protein
VAETGNAAPGDTPRSPQSIGAGVVTDASAGPGMAYNELTVVAADEHVAWPTAWCPANEDDNGAAALQVSAPDHARLGVMA